MKKIISVVLALVMALGCFSVMAFAYQDRAAVEITVTPTATSYNKGDVVTFEVYFEGSEEDAPVLGVPVVIGFGYDSTVFEPLADVSVFKNLTELENMGAPEIFIYDGYVVGQNQILRGNTSVESNEGATEKDAAKGWDKYISFKVGVAETEYQSYETKSAAFAFKLKVKEDANPNGSYTVGISDFIHTTEDIKIADPNGGVYGNDETAVEWGLTSPHMFSFIDGTVNVASAEASIITPMSSQIRFQGIGADSDKTNYTGKFDVRTRAKIANDDFVAKFGADGEKLADIGFIYASTTEVKDFSMATAQAVAQGTDATGYVKYSCKYVQHTGDGADYIFTCLIADIDDNEANKQDGVNCVAFAADTDGNYYFYSDVTTVSYGSLYTAYMPA